MIRFWAKEGKSPLAIFQGACSFQLGAETGPAALPGCERVETLVGEEGVLPAHQMGNQLGPSPPPENCDISLVKSTCSYFF